MKPKRLVTLKEACLYAKMGQTRMYEKMNAGIVDAYKHDRKTLIDLNSIDEMLAKELMPWKPNDAGLPARSAIKHRGAKQP